MTLNSFFTAIDGARAGQIRFETPSRSIRADLYFDERYGVSAAISSKTYFQIAFVASVPPAKVYVDDEPNSDGSRNVWIDNSTIRVKRADIERVVAWVAALPRTEASK